MLHWFLGALWFLCVPSGRAQVEATRARVFGSVVDGEGQPARGEVWLLSRPFPARADVGAPDLVRVPIDEQGRFAGNILRGRPYTAWAVLTSGVSDARVTGVQEDVMPGVVVALREDARRMPLSLVVSGLKHWPGTSLVVRAWSRTVNVHVEPIALDEKGTAALPWLPGDGCDIELALADGTVLVSRFTNLTRDEREAEVERLRRQIATAIGGPGRVPAAPGDAVPEPALDTVQVIVPLPRQVRVKVVAEDVPVAGAAVLQRNGLVPVTRAVPIPSGVTDAEGRLVVSVPSGVGPGGNLLSVVPAQLLVRASGRATTEQRLQLRAADQAAMDVVVRTQPGSEVRGRLLGKDGAPLAELPLLYETPVLIGVGSATTSFLQRVVTDREGRFVLPGVPFGAPCRLFADLSEAAAGLPASREHALCPMAWLVAGQAANAPETDLLDVVVPALRTVDVRVRSHDGAPVSCPHLLVIEGEPRNRSSQRPLEATADRYGRLRLILPRTALVVAATAPGLGFVACELPELPQDAPAVAPLTLALTQPVAIEGRVLTPDGKPVRDAVVTAAQTSVHADPVRARLLNRLHAAPVRTGVDGGFRLVLPVPDQTWQLRAHVVVDRRSYTGPAATADVGAEGLKGFDLELESPASQPVR